MKTNLTKPLCRFKQNCRNLKEGKQCPFLHNKSAKAATAQTCGSENQDHKQPIKQFQTPMNQIECKFGIHCNKISKGKCGFKHSDNFANLVTQNKAEIPCRYGDKCTAFKEGKCCYKHITQAKQRTLAPKNIFQTICQSFLVNFVCSQDCQYQHQFTSTNSITRQFAIANCEKELKTIKILQPFQKDQITFYAIAFNNKIVLGYLDHNTDAMMKRSDGEDVYVEGEDVENIWVVKMQHDGRKADILVCKCAGVKILIINQGCSGNFDSKEFIVTAVSLGNLLIILFQSGKTCIIEYIFSLKKFKIIEESFAEDFILLKKCSKLPKEEEIIVGVTRTNELCIIKQQLQPIKLRLKQTITDVSFAQISSIPVTLVLTESGNVYAVNLTTHEISKFLQTHLDVRQKELHYSCIAATKKHVFIGVGNMGVFVFQLEKSERSIGTIGIYGSKWEIDCDQQGNLVLISEYKNGRKDISIFKVRDI